MKLQQKTESRKRFRLNDDEWWEAFQDTGKQLAGATNRITDNRTDGAPIRDDERQALTPILEHGFEVIGSGLGRIVARFPKQTDHGDFIVKFARNGDGVLESGMYQNRVEVETWLEHGESDTCLLPPFEWHSSPEHCRWVIYPYATPIEESDISEPEVNYITDQLKTEVWQYGLAKKEVHPCNLVVWDDSVWLADYGRPEIPADW